MSVSRTPPEDQAASAEPEIEAEPELEAEPRRAAGDPSGPSPASFWPRLGAYLFDWLVVAGCSALVATSLNLGAKATTTSAGTDYVAANAGWPQLIFLVLSAVYAVAGWTLLGATVIQRAMGLRVYAAGTSLDSPVRLSTRMAVLRWFLVFGVVAGLGSLVILLPGLRNLFGLVQLVWIVVLIATTLRGREGQGLHDRLAGSVVVEA